MMLNGFSFPSVLGSWFSVIGVVAILIGFHGGLDRMGLPLCIWQQPVGFVFWGDDVEWFFLP
jgi:hypothetical protein